METTILNFIPDKTSPVIDVSQYDAGRVKRFMLYNGAIPYTLTGEETVELHIRKPNGEQNVFEVENTGENYLDLTLTEQMTDIAGRVYCKFHIDDLATKSFFMEVEPGPARIYTGYVNGEIVEFETDLEEDIIILNVELSPTQDFNGYDAPWAPGCGKNLLNVVDFKTASNWNTSWPTEGNMPAASSNPIYTVGKLQANKKYTVYFDFVDGNFPKYLYIGYYTDAGVTTRLAYITTNSISNQTYTFTAIADVNYCFRVQGDINFEENMSYITSMQLEQSESATAWAPYSNICPISGRTTAKIFRNSGNFDGDITVTINFDQEIYSGVLDYTAQVIRAVGKLVKISDYEWTKDSRYGFFRTGINDMEYNPDSGKKLNGLVSEAYVNRNASQAGLQRVNNSIAGWQNQLRIRDDTYNNVTDFVNAMGNTHFVYPLKTPIEIPFSGYTPIPTLNGENIVYSDAGPVEVAYHKTTQEGE